MNPRTLRSVALGIAVSATLLASACGSSDSSAPATTVTTTTPTSAPASADGLKVTGVWARTSPAMATAGAAYLQIANTGTTDDALLSVSVDPPVASKVELHETTTVTPATDGTDTSMTTTAPAGSNTSMPAGGGAPIMKMSPVDRIDVPAGKTATLKPGGYHVMLLGLSKPLEVGSKLTLTLTFEKAGAVKAVAEVRDTAP